MPRPHPTPARFLRLAWRGVRQVPGVWLVRGGFEVVAYLYRFMFVFGFGLLFVLHFAMHIEAGQPLDLWPIQLSHALAQPGTIAALGGLLLVGWTILFAGESLAYAGMWSALERASVGAPVRPWAGALHGAFATFGRAVGVRLLIRACEATLFVALIGSWFTAARLAAAVGEWTSSALLAPALTWAVLLTLVSVAAVVVRLTTELVAATVYIDDVGLGEGIVRAAQSILTRPVFLNRLFIVAAAVMIPPLLVGWLAAITQNVLLAADATAMASLLRFGAELAVVTGLVMFSVMMHATFFAYYAWTLNRIEPGAVSKKYPKLSELIPDSYDHMANVDDILGPWDDADHAKRRVESQAPKRPPAQIKPRKYDLNAILSGDQEE